MFIAVDLPEPFTPRSSSRPPPKCSTSFSYWYTFTMPARCSRHRPGAAPVPFPLGPTLAASTLISPTVPDRCDTGIDRGASRPRWLTAQVEAQPVVAVAVAVGAEVADSLWSVPNAGRSEMS